ncbi:MAG: site-specific DNA-methyltransferase [Muribaculaceae bacterium]|nr:site-specific DNA-methyltransferase [Muribaculaceae bacterium]
MEKLRMKSPDTVDGNVAKIAALFPQCVTERLNKDGKPELAIDFDKLRAELTKDVLEEGEERYQFTWPDKRVASRLANTPTDKTLRPDVDASVDFWNTQNLYIEGDNLDVLKVLRENYLGAIKMIYIDPPYNTGNDFVYNDDFAQGKDDFEATSGLYDEDGNQILDPMQRNTESNGRFHTDWLNMIYPRLKVARDLLSDDGVVFISIDENEINNMRKVCDEIFGSQNFIDTLHWKKKKQPSFLAKHTAKMMEYIVVYSKNKNLLEKLSIETLSDATKKVINISNPECTRHFKSGVRVKLGDNGIITKGRYTIKTMDVEYLTDVPYENGYTTKPVDVVARFSVGQDKIDKFIDEDLLFITANYGLRRDVSEEERNNRKSITDLLLSEYGDNQESDKEFLALFDKKYFDYTKPIALVYNFIKSNFTQDQYVLDFFSGSATTAHAVMKLNAEDGGKRKFIMVQLPEVTDEKSEARKAGYENICQIGEERIRRAGEKIKEEAGEKANGLDVGFRVLKLDSSNMEEVFYTPEDFNEQNLFNTVDNVKSDRTPLDLLFQVLPELDIELSAKIEEKDVNGKKVFFVDGTYLIATFDMDVNESTVTEIAKMKPQYFVMRDASAANDNVLDNFEQIFKHYSPDTIRKIL